MINALIFGTKMVVAFCWSRLKLNNFLEGIGFLKFGMERAKFHQKKIHQCPL
jgi:hypothetical protein